MPFDSETINQFYNLDLWMMRHIKSYVENQIIVKSSNSSQMTKLSGKSILMDMMLTLRLSMGLCKHVSVVLVSMLVLVFSLVSLFSCRCPCMLV